MNLLKNRHFPLLLALLALIPLFSSCLKDESEELIAKEKDLLQWYIQQNNITTEPRPSGLYFIEEQTGSGLMPETGDFVNVNYTLRMLDGEILIYTTDSLLAKEEEVYSKWQLYGPETILTGINIRGLDEGLSLMREGGKARLIIPSDLAWGSGGYPAPVGSYVSVIIDLELVKVIPDLEENEEIMIQQFILQHDFPSTIGTDGIYFQEIVAGTGDSVDYANYITIDLKASLLDGREIANRDSIKFSYGSTINALITTGASRGLGRMREGGEARWIAPSVLCYGEYTRLTYDQLTRIPVPAYSAILYEAKIRKVE